MHSGMPWRLPVGEGVKEVVSCEITCSGTRHATNGAHRPVQGHALDLGARSRCQFSSTRWPCSLHPGCSSCSCVLLQNEFFKKASTSTCTFIAPHGLGWYSNATVQCERGVQPRARPSHKIPASPALAAMRLLGAGLSGLYHGRPPSSSSVCRGLQKW